MLDFDDVEESSLQKRQLNEKEEPLEPVLAFDGRTVESLEDDEEEEELELELEVELRDPRRLIRLNALLAFPPTDLLLFWRLESIDIARLRSLRLANFCGVIKLARAAFRSCSGSNSSATASPS